jgi:hypothetical protein
MTLYCCICGKPNEFARNWIESEDACIECGTRGRWRRYNDPTVEYALNENDRRLLRSLRIEAE